MLAKAQIEAGVCGFSTLVSATCEDGQSVAFDISTDCEKIAGVARRLAAHGPVDAFQEISPAAESVILAAARAELKGCCAACAAPVGIFKCMQAAARLALPQDIAIKIVTE